MEIQSVYSVAQEESRNKVGATAVVFTVLNPLLALGKSLPRNNILHS